MDADLVVVGNGVIGLSTALACGHRHPDLRIIVIGPSRRPGAASPAAAAMLAAASEARPSTFDDPGTTRWLELVCEAVRRWPEWLEELAERSRIPSSRVPGIARGIAVVGDEHDPGFDAIERASTRFGSPIREMDAGEIGLLKHGLPRRCLMIEDEGGIDPLQLLRFLEQALDAVDVGRSDARVDRVEPGRVLLESGGEVRSDRILLAAGSDCRRLLDSGSTAHESIPRIGYGHGVGLRGRSPSGIRVPGHAIRTPNRDDGSNLYLVPHGDDCFYMGATTALEDRPRLAPLPREIAAIREAATRFLASELLDGTLNAVIGSRPVSEDGLPVLGQLGDGLWIATGTDRDGLSAAPELSRCLADGLSERTDSIPSCFKPSRKRSGFTSAGLARERLEVC